MSTLGIACFAAATLCTVFLIYPYVIYPILLKALPRVEGRRRLADTPTASILFCAYNEGAALPDKLRNLRDIKERYPDVTILAYSDSSSDQTNVLLEEAGDLLIPVFGAHRQGKVAGMRHLVALANSEVLIFTDANVHVPTKSIGALLEHFKDESVGAVGATLYYTSNPDQGATVTETTGGLYWRLEEQIKQLETATGSMMGADGSLFACRRSGYPELDEELVDDLAASLSALFQGNRCISAADVVATEHGVTDRAEEFRRKRRIACGSYSTYQFMKADIAQLSWIDRWKFYSHKVLRWWGLFYLVFAWVFAALCAAQIDQFEAFSATSLLGAALLLVAARLGFKSAGMLLEIALSITATGVGVMESIAGRSYATWKPASSR